MTATEMQKQAGMVVRPEHVATIASPLFNQDRHTAVGIRVRGGWAGGESLSVDGEVHPVVHCISPLAAREALDGFLQKKGPAPILLTPLSENELGWDVLIRLAKRRLIEVTLWDTVHEHFRAQMVDPSIAAHPVLAQVLIENVPPGGYPPVPLSFLDVDTAWEYILDGTLGLHNGRPDADAILEASMNPAFSDRFSSLPEALKPLVLERFAETAGAVGELLGSSLSRGNGNLLLSLGLACDVIFSDASTAPDLSKAAVRLEQYVDQKPVDATAARRWAAAAGRVLGEMSDTVKASVYRDAERILSTLGADGFVYVSDDLPSSYDRRLQSFAGSITAFLKGRGNADEAEEALRSVMPHSLARSAGEESRLCRLEMSVRLVRFLASGGTNRPGSERLDEAVAQYVKENSFLDRARTALRSGDPHPHLAAAFEALSEKASTRRELDNEVFARALARWTESPAEPTRFTPIENVLRDIVVPLAQTEPVLVLVMDGMGFASFRELIDDLHKDRWIEWVPSQRNERLAALATAPSITRISRASLFAGTIMSGAAGDEKRAFQKHAELLNVSRSKLPPVLFHKGDLTAGRTDSLADAVREALQNPEQRVVAAVINAIDDSLTKSDQIRSEWALEHIPLLQAILYEADVANRLVILLSDHGHVLEASGSLLFRNEEVRWRRYAEPVADEEIVLQGPRVRAATEEERIIVPWSERVRFGNKSTGYHGGVTPQEMVIPIAVLSTWEIAADDWNGFVEAVPPWWNGDEVPDVREVTASPRHRAKTAVLNEPGLFDDWTRKPEPSHDAGWIDKLLHSSQYEAQRRMAGRMAPPEEDVRSFLDLMSRNHGRASRGSVAAALRKPELRVRGVMVGFQRLFNVDGYPIVTSDESDTIELNLDLLRKQFEIEDEP